MSPLRFLSLPCNEGLVLRCIAALTPRCEHASRLRAAHRRRRPKGLDARGAPRPRAATQGGTHRTESDCRRIFGLSGWSKSLRAIMEIRTRGANRLCTTSKARRFIGVSPRRSDRCAICYVSSVQSSWGDEHIDGGAGTRAR